MTAESVPVLVVGGSMVGLAMASFLAARGVRCLVVERRRTMSVQPRARGVNPRAMEVLRQFDLEQPVRAARSGLTIDTGVIVMTSLAGFELRRVPQPTPEDLSRVTPCQWSLTDQDKLEPVLRAHAERHGADIRFDTELISFEQDVDGVTARLRSPDRGEYAVRAKYLVAADGHRSFIRKQVGIPTSGRGTIDHVANILFRADLTEAQRGRNFYLSFVANWRVRAALSPIDTDHRWMLSVSYKPSKRPIEEEFAQDRCVRLVRAATGLKSLDVTILDVRPWEMAARTADRYASGRIFLAGDAAHVMPPTGGFGGNTGIQDAHNLAWKLAWVLGGKAGPELLATYDAERRPVGELTVEQVVLRHFDRAQKRAKKAGAMVADLDLMLGYRYESTAVVSDDERTGPGAPGTRAPHVWLTRDGQQISTLDLFGDCFVVVAGAKGSSWCEAARKVGDQRGIPITAVRMDDTETVGESWSCAYGVSPDGAVLVRPDGFVAWRSSGNSDQAFELLEAALSSVLGGRSYSEPTYSDPTKVACAVR